MAVDRCLFDSHHIGTQPGVCLDILLPSLCGHVHHSIQKVGMLVPKSTQTRVVGIITYMVHPHAHGAMLCIHVFIKIVDLQ